ncbi:hypothetical protein K504DRAFT_447973 [Pleomassaria siparia CBS 279.74]|uniref:Uncharacterized protein n=1 Tax=Pleomassaria siparia CBS 279.74 TaxID=1314801 RepID=A0A6G1K0K2_9PLEO|nr:hypothetical protein K504DRAFT_447973 [Pleomassaria siparia CBS 279.74]
MSTETPSSPKESPSKSLTPSWALSFYRRQRSPRQSQSALDLKKRSQSVSQSASPSASQSQPGGLLVPQLTSISTSDSDESPSIRSSRSRGRGSFKDMMNRLRSSSSVTLVDEGIQESDFKHIDNWYHGFDRYNQLVTTQTSPNQSYESEEFSRISNTLTKNCGGRFLHGLPEAVFDFSLLWCPAGSLTRKDSQEPSWSWTGWEGPVNFPFDVTNSPDLQSTPKSDGQLFRSEVTQYHVGPQSAPYTVRREKKEADLRIQFPPYFHAPRGSDASVDSNTLFFTAYTIPAEGFSIEQLTYENKEIPCSHLINESKQHCGVIMDFEEAISAPSSTGPFEFILVSRNLRREPLTHTRRPAVPTIHPPGTPIWDGTRFVWDQEVVDFDEEVFATGPWKVLNVVLIKWVGDHAERVAVARIHEDAWLKLSPVKKHIVLR